MKNVPFVTGALVALLLLGGVQSEANAQWSVGPYTAYNFDAEEFMFGLQLRATLPTKLNGTRLVANPGFEFYPFFGPDGSSSSFWTLNADVLYEIDAKAISPYVGGGLFVRRASVETLGISAADTDVGLNLKGGSLFGPRKRAQFFGEGILQLGGGSTFVLKGGAFFHF